MAESSIEKKTEEFLKNTITSLGYELYDVEYIKEGKEYHLCIYIDKIGGIDINDCERVNDAINPILDEADYIKEQYFLEVSSPGIERVLKKDKHLQANINSKVSIKLFKPLESQKQFIGELKMFDDKTIKLKIDEKLIEIERTNIAQIRKPLIFTFVFL